MRRKKPILVSIAGIVVVSVVAAALTLRSQPTREAPGDPGGTPTEASESPVASAPEPESLPTAELIAPSLLLRSRFDPGVLTFAVRNPEEAEVRIVEIRLNEETLTEDLEAGIQCLWHRLSSKSVPRGRFAFFQAQLQGRLDKPVEVTVALADGRELCARTAPIPAERTVRLIGASFDQGLQSLFLYLHNGTSDAATVETVETPGIEVGSVDLAAREIQPGDTAPLVLTLKSPAPWGTHVPLLIRFEGGRELSAGFLRAFSDFPIAKESALLKAFSGQPVGVIIGDITQDLGIGNYDPGQKKYAFLPNCPMHTFGSRAAAAQEALAEAAKAEAKKDKPVTIIHVCRRNHAQAYALFGQIADVTNVNTSVPTEYYDSRRDNDPSPVEWNAKLLFESCAPVPYFAVIPLFNEVPISAKHLQTTETDVILSALGSVVWGAHGILYRGGRDDTLRGGHEKLRVLNKTFRTLAADLMTSGVGPFGRCSERSVRVGSRLCGKGSLLLILLNYKRADKTPPNDVPQTCALLNDVEVTVRLPDWFKPGDLTDVAGGTAIPWEAKPDDQIMFKVDRLDVYRILRLAAANVPAEKKSGR